MTKTQLSVAAFALGMIIGALGWIANESTKSGAAKWGTPGIAVGVTLIVCGIIGMAVFSNRK